MKSLCILALAAASIAAAGPFTYTFSAPAITTGLLHADAFSVSFKLADFVIVSTDITALPSLQIPNTFAPGFNTLTSAVVFPDGLWFNFSNGTDTLLGSIVTAPATMDHVGAYSPSWQIVNNGAGIVGDVVEGSLTITTSLGSNVPIDLPLIDTPEPASIALVAGGLALVWRRSSTV